MTSAERLWGRFRISSFLYTRTQGPGLTKSQLHGLTRLVFATLAGVFTGSIAAVEQQIFGVYQSDLLRYWLTRAALPFQKMADRLDRYVYRLAIRLALEGKKKISIIIDDTTVRKDRRSKHLPAGFTRKKGKGFTFVTAILQVGRLTLPLTPRLYLRRELAESLGIPFHSKLDMACGLIESAVSHGLTKHVTLKVDAWYSSTLLIQTARSHGWKVVTAVRSNRCFKSNNTSAKTGSKVRNLRCHCRTETPHKVRRDDFTHWLTTLKGTFRGIDEPARLLLSNRIDKKGRSTWKYVAVFGDIRSPEKILDSYMERWNIEVFHRIWKHAFRPEKWRLNSAGRIQNLAFLTILAMVLAVRSSKTSMIHMICRGAPEHENSISYSLREIRSELHSVKGELAVLFRKQFQ